MGTVAVTAVAGRFVLGVEVGFNGQNGESKQPQQ